MAVGKNPEDTSCQVECDTDDKRVFFHVQLHLMDGL